MGTSHNLATEPMAVERARRGYLYALCFSDGLVKVGRSANPAARIAQHAASMAPAGLTLARQHQCECIGSDAVAEKRALLKCAAAASEQRQNEWFVGLDFDTVIAWVNEAAGTNDADAAQARSQFVLRRDSSPWEHDTAYICRACCRFHDATVASSAFLCPRCIEAGYEFFPRARAAARSVLTLLGVEVNLWSASANCAETAPYEGVPSEELRPDCPWLRIRDEQWFLGRPVVDHARAAPAGVR